MDSFFRFPFGGYTVVYTGTKFNERMENFFSGHYEDFHQLQLCNDTNDAFMLIVKDFCESNDNFTTEDMEDFILKEDEE